MDMDEWERLPLAQRISSTDASNGLLNGDLLPLAAHIRSGWPIDDVLAKQLADAIEGPDEEGFTLRMAAPRGRKLTFDERDKLHRRNLDIALFVFRRRAELGEAGLDSVSESIWKEVQEKWGVSRSTATSVVADVEHDLGQEYGGSRESS